MYLVEQGMVALPHCAAPLLHHTLRGALYHPGRVQPGGGYLGLDPGGHVQAVRLHEQARLSAHHVLGDRSVQVHLPNILQR